MKENARILKYFVSVFHKFFTISTVAFCLRFQFYSTIFKFSNLFFDFYVTETVIWEPAVWET